MAFPPISIAGLAQCCEDILSGRGYGEEFLAMGVIAAAFCGIGIVWFQKKDLPL